MQKEFLNVQNVDNQMDPYKKNCKYRYCNREFVAKRLNQLYCNYDHKKKENNCKAKEIRDKTKDIDFIIRRNRRILKDFFYSGKTEVNYNDLELQGFNHKYSTHIEKESDGNARIPYYYEYGLVLINSDIWRQFKIINKNGKFNI